MIKAVIFDLSGVIFKGKHFIKKGEKILGKTAVHNNDACFDRKLCLGTSSHRAAFERVFGKKLFDDEFIKLMKAWLSNWEIDEEMLALAKKLRRKYKLAVLSNSEQAYEEKYDNTLRKVFPIIVYSHRVRMLKPEKPIFEYTLKQLGVQPPESVMIDDVKENCETGKKLGMNCILFKNRQQCESELKNLGAKI